MVDIKENDKFDLGAKGLTNGITIIIHVSSVIHRFCSNQPLKKKKKNIGQQRHFTSLSYLSS